MKNRNFILKIETWAEEKGGLFGRVLAFIVRLNVGVFNEFRRTHCIHHAGYLAYLSILALVPLFFLSFYFFSVYGPLVRNPDGIQNFIYEHFLPGTGDRVAAFINQVLSQTREISTSIGILGFVFLSLVAVSLFAGIEKTFNIIWRSSRNRNFFYRFFVLWGTVTLIPIIFSLAVYLKIRFYRVEGLINYTVLPLLLLILALFSMYLFIPTVRVKKCYALVSAILAGGIWYYIRAVFEVYIRDYATANILYGSLAILPLLLLWFYLSWIIFLGGVVLNFILQNISLLRDQDFFSEINSGEKLLLGLNILYLLKKNYSRRRGISVNELVSFTNAPPFLVEEIIDCFVEKGILTRSSDEETVIFSFNPLDIDWKDVLGTFGMEKIDQDSSPVARRTRLEKEVLDFYNNVVVCRELEEHWRKFFEITDKSVNYVENKTG